MRKYRQIMLFVLFATVIQSILFMTVPAFADTKASFFPETGKKEKTDGSLTIDYSHMDQGYVLVRAEKADRSIKLKVDHGSDSLYYGMNGDGKNETIPLQYGSGTYRFTLFIAQRKDSNQYKRAGTVTLKSTMKDETSCFLYPNQYVSYRADSPFIEKAQELCKDLNDPMEIAKAICKYIRANFSYDWNKSANIRSNNTKNMLPDIETTWNTKLGVCQDLSALTCAMLRSQGVPAKLAIGSADGSCHSWVVIIVDGKSRRFDPTGSAGNYKAERYY